jgi:hypothetical protein
MLDTILNLGLNDRTRRCTFTPTSQSKNARSPAPSHWTANPAATDRQTHSSGSWMDCDEAAIDNGSHVVPAIDQPVCGRSDPRFDPAAARWRHRDPRRREHPDP